MDTITRWSESSVTVHISLGLIFSIGKKHSKHLSECINEHAEDCETRPETRKTSVASVLLSLQ